ncbi:oligoribonuclease [Salvia hispanica]|uniref:oligoribonuclease n=1 Tax=Salvia hispanica TaxID=49212 RepID=UPI0020097F8A|nr:oligoribonuclease [Salvia hispanica]XP_047941175.1 oligoribonuclease [Salvia hispanica]
MDKLSNSFSLLELDAEDAKEHNLTATIAADGCETRDSGKGVDNGLEDGTLLEKESVDQQSSESIVGDYKMPLVWIDLEMTGLNIEVDRILEIACIITNGNLTKSVEGPDLVIHQSKECLDKMGEWCQEHHGESGLTERVLQSTISEHEAENQVIEFVKRHTGTAYTPLLAGNSVYMDLIFLRKYMPDLAALFSHNLVDVSSIKALCLRWYPRDRRKAPQKENKHRAMDDIKESIAELKFYKENIFKPKKSRK